MEDQSVGSSNSVHSADGVCADGCSTTTETEEQVPIISAVMGTFLCKGGSVASMASIFERASLAKSQQPLAGSKTNWSRARTKLSDSSNFSASKALDHSKSPSVSPRRAEECNAEDDDVFSCASSNPVCQRSSMLDSMTSTTSNASQQPVSEEQKPFVLEDKPCADFMSLYSKHPSMQESNDSSTDNMTTQSGPLWSAPRKKQVRNMHSSSPNPVDQSSITAGPAVLSSTKSRASRRRHCLSYDGATTNLDSLSATSRSHDEGIQQTLKKSYTVEADLLSVQAPKVTVRISSTKVDHCQLDMLTRYRQTPSAIVQVTGDTDSD